MFNDKRLLAISTGIVGLSILGLIIFNVGSSTRLQVAPHTDKERNEAQATPRIVGHVTKLTDELPIRGASIQLYLQKVETLPDGMKSFRSLDEAQNLGVLVHTDEAGYFVLDIDSPTLPQFYLVTAEATGFQKQLFPNIEILANDTVVTDFQLVPTNPSKEEAQIIERKFYERRQR